MAIWISTIALVVVLAMIMWAQIRNGRRSKVKFANTARQIDDLAKVTYDRHREMFGKDATGSFPGVAKK